MASKVKKTSEVRQCFESALGELTEFNPFRRFPDETSNDMEPTAMWLTTDRICPPERLGLYIALWKGKLEWSVSFKNAPKQRDAHSYDLSKGRWLKPPNQFRRQPKGGQVEKEQLNETLHMDHWSFNPQKQILHKWMGSLP